MEGRRFKPTFALLAVGLFGLVEHQALASSITADVSKDDTGSTEAVTSEPGAAGWERDSHWGRVDHSRSGSRSGIFTLDDVVYEDIEAEVNEAGGLILLGIGLVGLWAARRRIRA